MPFSGQRTIHPHWQRDQVIRTLSSSCYHKFQETVARLDSKERQICRLLNWLQGLLSNASVWVDFYIIDYVFICVLSYSQLSFWLSFIVKQIPVKFEKVVVFDNQTGQQVGFRCGFSIGGGIDQDFRYSPGYTDSGIYVTGLLGFLSGFSPGITRTLTWRLSVSSNCFFFLNRRCHWRTRIQGRPSSWRQDSSV
jgi:hypothetical protein